MKYYNEVRLDVLLQIKLQNINRTKLKLNLRLNQNSMESGFRFATLLSIWLKSKTECQNVKMCYLNIHFILSYQ